MPPDPLAPLFAPLTALKGAIPPVAALIAKAAGGERVIDLLFHLPESYVDRRPRPTIAEAQPGTVATLEIEVVRHEPPATPRQPWRVVVKDNTGFAELVFFAANPKSAEDRAQRMPPGAKLLVSGKLEEFNGRLTMPHPDHVLPLAQADRLPGIEPVWRMTAGLWPRQVGNAMRDALLRLPDFPEWHDPALLRREKWPPFAEALRAVQSPAEPPDDRLRARLAYDELLAGQVASGRGARPGARPPRPRPAWRRLPAREGAGTVRLHPHPHPR